MAAKVKIGTEHLEAPAVSINQMKNVDGVYRNEDRHYGGRVIADGGNLYLVLSDFIFQPFNEKQWVDHKFVKVSESVTVIFS